MGLASHKGKAKRQTQKQRHTHIVTGSASVMRPHQTGLAGQKTQRTNSPPPPAADGRATAPPTTDSPHVRHQRKSRRLENVTLESIFQEVSLYLDAARAAAADDRTVASASVTATGGFSVQTTTMSIAAASATLWNASAVDRAVAETLQVLRECWEHAGDPRSAFTPVRSLSTTALRLLVTYGEHELTADTQYAMLKGGPASLIAVGALMTALRSVALPLVRAAARVERKRRARALAAANGQLQQLNGSACDSDGHLASALNYPTSASTRQEISDCTPSSPFQTYNLHHATSSANSISSTQPYTSSAALLGESSQESLSGALSSPAQPGLPSTHGFTRQQQQPQSSNSPPAPLPVSRLALLNCRSFGWVDSIGDEGYERSTHTLRRVSHALDALVRDPVYATVGRALTHREEKASPYRETVSVVPAATLVLLTDAVLMEGGLPSLALAGLGGGGCNYASSGTNQTHSRSTVLTALHRYGRGLACIALQLPPWHPVTDSHGCFVTSATPPPTPQHSLTGCGRGMGGDEESSVPSTHISQSNPALLPTPTTTARETADAVEDEEALLDDLYRPSTGPASIPVAPSTNGSPRCSLRSFNDLRPVSCGTRALPGLVAQAVLVAPNGPLLLHIQFDWRTCSRGGQPPPNSSHHSAAVGVVEEAMTAVAAMNFAATTSTGTANVATSGELAPDAPSPQQAAEVMQWLLQLLRCPQPVMLVEWHVDGSASEAASTGLSPITAVATSLQASGNSPTADSAVMRLLRSYAEASAGTEPLASGYPHGDADVVSDTARRFTPWPGPAMPQPDGRLRPFIFTRGLELAPEGERMVGEDIIITSLQYRSAVQ